MLWLPLLTPRSNAPTVRMNPELASFMYGLSGGLAFHLSDMNEIAFTVAPAELKMLDTAIMLYYWFNTLQSLCALV